ncbi:MAG: cytosolic protein [Candidatus Levybacteria bacterium]|nr:cytosolic protein [Candidatus Levybacteria bacterium]
MHNFDQNELQTYVSEGVITPFYKIRIQKLTELTFNDVMKRKNPYLFKAKNIQTAEELIRYILDAFLSSQEETIFGDLMEGLAIFACGKVFSGYKAEKGKFKSIDLIFKRDERAYMIGIKSGPNWGNSDQIGRMKTNFKAARKILRSEGEAGKIIAVNGCMYGKDNRPHKVDKKDEEKSYYKFCGQEFWELITEDKDFYQKIVIPIDKEAKKRDESFRNMYNAKINELTKNFSGTYLTEYGHINWEKIIDFVSKKN